MQAVAPIIKISQDKEIKTSDESKSRSRDFGSNNNTKEVVRTAKEAEAFNFYLTASLLTKLNFYHRKRFLNKVLGRKLDKRINRNG